MTLRLPRLPGNQAIVDANGIPTIAFSTAWQQLVTQLETAINEIEAIPEIQTALSDLDAATAAAQAAAAEANSAAATAQSSATGANDNAKLANSYISPSSVLTASPTLITVASHTRFYADGTSVAVNGGTVAATASGDVDFVSYNDPTFAGGTVSYQGATLNPAQVAGIHVVGAVTIPSTGTHPGGDGPVRPGLVEP